MTLAKKLVRCSHCGREMMRTKCFPVNSCVPCKSARKAKWFKANPGANTTACLKWRSGHRDTYRKSQRAWRKANPKKVRAINKRAAKRFRRKERELNAEVIKEIAALCDCGQRHTEENRMRILGRLLPMTTHEIREAWSCIWGLPFEDQSAGAKRLYRDLERLSAERIDGTYYLQKARAA